MPTYEIPHRPHPRVEGATSTSEMVDAPGPQAALAQVRAMMPEGHIALFVRRVDG